MRTKVLESCTIIPNELYVRRDADKQLRNIIKNMGRPGYILVARQMGKTNLIINAKRELEDEENIFVYLDLSNYSFDNSRNCFRSIIDTAIETHEHIFHKCRQEIHRNRKNLDIPPHKEHERELRLLLRGVKGKIVVSLDEIGALTEVPFSDEIFAQIRSIYFSRVNFREYERLTYILAGVAEPSELIKNKNISPFNIGEKIYLDDFSYQEFWRFLHQANLDFSNEAAERIYYWANGNPRIVWDLCSELEDVKLEGMSLTVEHVDSAVKKLYLTTVNKAPVDNIRDLVIKDKEIRNAVILIKNNKGSTLSNDLKNKLYLAGIIKSDYHSEETGIKNRVIEYSLSDQWLVSAEHYPLSRAQTRLWYLSQFDDFHGIFNLQFAFQLEGKLNTTVLETAFYKVVQRHEPLRTTFITIGGLPWQTIHEKIDFHLSIVVLSSEDEPQKDIPKIASQDLVKPFDLVEGPLFRVTLFRLTSERHVLLVNVHGIIFDSYSIGIFLRELSHIYQCCVDNTNSPLQSLQYQYKDYANWQDKLLKNKILDIHREYWLNKLSSGEIQVLNLPFDFQTPPAPGSPVNGDMVSFSINPDMIKRLRGLSREKEVSLFVTLLTLVKILLYRYSEQEDMSIVIPVTGRNTFKLKGLIGLFENQLVLRDTLKDHHSFEDILKAVKQTEKEALEYQDYPFEELLAEFQPSRDIRSPKVFNVMVKQQGIDESKLFFKTLHVSPFTLKSRRTNYDLSFNFMERKSDLLMGIEFNTDLFLRGTIERMGRHFFRLIHGILVDGKEADPIEGLDILSEEEYKEILFEFNNTGANFPLDKTLDGIFQEQVEINPDNTAVVYMDKYLTYRRLNEKANQVAYFIKEKYAVRPDDPVGLIFDNTEWSLIGLLGILKAGAAYVPIDSGYPYERKVFLIEDCDCKFILAMDHFDFIESRYSKGINGTRSGLHSVNIRTIRDTNCFNPGPIHQSHHLAYLIYTSGSTGRPKGVMIEHRSVINLVNSFYKKVFSGFAGYLNFYLRSPLSFDFSVMQIFCALFKGHSLHLGYNLIWQDVPGFTLYLQMHLIDIVDIVPTFLSYMIDGWLSGKGYCPLKHFVLGGEEVSIEYLKHFYSIAEHHDINFTYVYGPTECCVWSTSNLLSFQEVNQRGKIPIGAPINNLEIYILNRRLQLLPIGVPGEICISGVGLARGYLNRRELTLERFIYNPFKKGKRLYRTGDRGKWLPGGNIEYLGRLDYQVKIRGFRIEIGEIENVLCKHEKVKEAVVLVRKDEKGVGHLCAYFISENIHTPSELKEYLSGYLPGYMIPSYFVPLEKIPLTPNGKIDRKALPDPGKLALGTTNIAPRDEFEEKLVEIWSQLLGIEKNNIGIEDNFFDVGGNSLILIQMVSKIQQAMNVKVPLSQVFVGPKIWELAEFIKKAMKDSFLYVKVAEAKEYYELSPTQKRLYILHLIERETVIHNLPFITEIKGELDRDKLSAAFKKLIERHDNLRTSFLMVGGEVVQVIHQNEEIVRYFQLETLNETGLLKNGETKLESGNKNIYPLEGISVTINYQPIIKSFIKPFDLSKAPLFRVQLIEIDRERYLLMIDMHQIISDDLSKTILLNDIVSLYNGDELPVLRVQYKDFAEWQKNKKSEEVMKRQEEYWRKELSGDLPVLDLPIDYARPATREFDSDGLRFEISRDEKEKLEMLASEVEEGLSMYMLFLSIFNILLSKYTGQEDIIVVTTINGRPHTVLEPIIGAFENILVLRNYPVSSKSFEIFLQQVKKRTVKAFENRDYRFEDLMVQLSIPKEQKTISLFNAAFDLKSADNIDIKIEDFNIIRYDDNWKSKYSKYDIALVLYEIGDRIFLEFIYSTRLFKRSTIEMLQKRFREIITVVLENKKIKLEDIRLSLDLALLTGISKDDYADLEF